jgi:hypothetical protein
LAKGKTKMEFLEVMDYWNRKDSCKFKHCDYGVNHSHNALNIDVEYAKHNFNSILKVNVMNIDQIRIFNAISPVWKIMLLDRIYNEVYWKDKTSYEILKSENTWEEYEDVTDEKSIKYAMLTNEMEEYPEYEKLEKDELDSKASLGAWKKRNQRHKDVCNERRKMQEYQSEFSNRIKFEKKAI